jgi:hypothetical protein
MRRSLPAVIPAHLLPLVFLLLFVLASGLTEAVAQTPFALRNVGQRITPDDARMVGRGGWGMAVTDSLHPGFKNIASLSSIRHVVIGFTGYGEVVDSEDARGTRETTRAFSPNVRLAAPIIKERLAFTAGFVVDRSTQYTTSTDTSRVVWEDTTSGNDLFVREGNKFKVPLGLAFQLFPGLSFSAAFNLESGSIREALSNYFPSPFGIGSNNLPQPIYQTNAKESKDEYKGTSQTFGLLFRPFGRLGLGASWTPSHKIDVERKVEQFGVAKRFYDSFTMEMPDEYMAGVQLRLFGRWRVGGDYQLQRFSRFEGVEEWMAEMEDEYTWSAGLERVQARVRRGGLNNLPIRLGASIRHWAYRVGGEPVEEKTLSLGTGFPFQANMGQLDVGLSYSRIGDLGSNGTESEVWRLTVSVTGLERWY